MTGTKKVEYPRNRVVATLDPAMLDDSLDELTSAGVSRDGIQIITPDDIGNIDSPLTETGATGFMHRLILSIGVDLSILEQLRKEVVSGGRVIVTVPVDGDDERDKVATTFRNLGAHALRYFGDWTVQRL